MKCGHCKRDDAAVTVAHVRGCDGRQSFAPADPEPFASGKLSDINETIRTKGLEGALRDVESRGSTLTADRPAPNRRERRDVINADIRSAERAVPAGRYAVRNEAGEWRFYKVDKPTEGRWAGYTFVKHLASDTEHPVKGIEQRLTILLKIGVDAGEASRNYGLQIGSCGVCSKTLTNAESLARGIGPICAAKMGW